jgi:transposase InsO family protein
LKKIDELSERYKRVSEYIIMSKACFSRSQLYRWKEGEQLERKERARKAVPESTVENAAAVIATFPHLGGCKGQAYMLYHQLGYLSMKGYDGIKKKVKRLIGQEISRRKLLPGRECFEHVRPVKPGEIWAEDFTEVVVERTTFKLAVLLDIFDEYYLGAAAASRATASLVARPIDQALEKNDGKGPEKFLLSDNGSQYISEDHQTLLSSAEIVQRRIPACVPQYNGCVEGGMRDLKSIFYNVWERRAREGADEEKNLLERVQAALEETVFIMNEAIPRPALGGVTPADVHNGRKEAKREEVRTYREEESRRDVPPWTRNYWEVLKSGIKAEEMSSGELLIKLAFFGRRPLRRIARRNRECVG